MRFTKFDLGKIGGDFRTIVEKLIEIMNKT